MKVESFAKHIGFASELLLAADVKDGFIPHRKTITYATRLRQFLRLVTGLRSRSLEGVERGTVRYLRVLEEVPRPWATRKSWYQDDRDGMAHTAIGDDMLGLKVQHGIVPVEQDGSAHFTVPAMRNIYFQALDEDLLAVQTERTYVHYMPGETRSCIGCHALVDE